MNQEFRWVNARGKCSAFEVLKSLQSGCESDVAERHAIRDRSDPKERADFKITSDSLGFQVLREAPAANASVRFRIAGSGIAVHGDTGALLVKATLTLNDDGECRLRAGTAELTFWQFRKRALEDLFFNF